MAKFSLIHARDCLRDALQELEAISRRESIEGDEIAVEAVRMAIMRVSEAVERLQWILEGSV